MQIDLAGNRSSVKYAGYEQVLRVLWGLGRWLIHLSPRPCFGWRRLVLRMFGARVGVAVHVYPSARIYMPWNVELGEGCALGEDVFIYSLGKIRIGRNATLSYRAHACAGSHDLEDPALPLLKPPVVIGEGVWIGTEAFIGPGVTLGQGAVVGARAVVMKDVEPLHIVAGNPARTVRMRAMRSR